MSQSDREYFQQRVIAERALAAAATSANVAAIHEELAKGYEVLAAREDSRPDLRVVTPDPEQRPASA